MANRNIKQLTFEKDGDVFTINAITTEERSAIEQLLIDVANLKKFTVSLDFDAVSTFEFNCPLAMKILTVESSPAADVTITKAGVPYVLGDALAKFDILMITPSVPAFINLNCTEI